MDLIIVPGHGEGKSLYYVVDRSQPQDEQPAVVYTAHSHSEAEHYIHGDIGGEA